MTFDTFSENEDFHISDIIAEVESAENAGIDPFDYEDNVINVDFGIYIEDVDIDSELEYPHQRVY